MFPLGKGEKADWILGTTKAVANAVKAQTATKIIGIRNVFRLIFLYLFLVD